MKSFTIVFLFLFLFISKTFAGYYTPNSGVRWSLDDLVANSGGVVTFSSGFYTFNDTVKVSKFDTLYITSDAIVKFALNKSLTVTGMLYVNPPTGVLFTPLDTANKFSGVRIDSSTSSIVRKLTMEYSVAFRITDGAATVDSCIFSNNGLATSSLTNSAMVPLRTTNKMIVTNCKFIDNFRSAIETGSNTLAPITISNCYFSNNNKLNLNKPNINLANSGIDTVKIIENTFDRPHGTSTGGISFVSSSGQCNAIIVGNVIKNNRYGINVQGGSSITYLRIAYNQLDSNNIQNNPTLGGSGIACSGGTAVSQPNTIITGNTIRWNLWGITMQQRSKPNVGNITNADTSDDGKNIIYGNTARQIDLFNNTIDDIFAQNNYWGTGNRDSVAMRIFDKTDSTVLGTVYYTPVKSYTPTSVPNYGVNSGTGNASYSFANSTASGSGSPSQPTFAWRDTTGSTSLIVNRVNVGTLSAGNINDGTYDIMGQFSGDVIRFFGVNYSYVIIGTNGIVGFQPYDPTTNIAPPATGVPQANVTYNAFPLWMDFDFSSVSGPATNRLSYKISGDEVIVTYDNAYVSGGTASSYVSFQVVMQKKPLTAGNSRILFQYDFNHTGVDFITQYNNNTLPTHFVGLQGLNNGTDYAAYRFKTANALVTPGPLFGSPLALAFGLDNTELPVELAAFTANTNGSNVNLNWSTVSELNNSGFDIERKSIESSQWSKIAFVNGNGTSNISHSYSYSDNNLGSGKYNYRLKQVDYNGNHEYFNLAGEIIIGVPAKFNLAQNYPNPFNPVTKINYELPVQGFVSLKIYDMTGKEISEIVNTVQTAGYYSVDFNAMNFASGAYFYKLTSGNFSSVKKMMVIK